MKTTLNVLELKYELYQFSMLGLFRDSVIPRSGLQFLSAGFPVPELAS
jgi:hypothetical protein